MDPIQELTEQGPEIGDHEAVLMNQDFERFFERRGTWSMDAWTCLMAVVCSVDGLGNVRQGILHSAAQLGDPFRSCRKQRAVEHETLRPGTMA
ncbi:MAG: hypothetical protein ACRDZ8_08930 [Acidimicrobiales bacterium]